MQTNFKEDSIIDNRNLSELLESESKYISYGDTVHYLKEPTIFTNCEGSFMYDYKDTPWL